MSTVHVIALDTHSQTTDVCVKTQVKQAARRWRVKTSIAELVQVIEQVPGRRELVLEEGPLAGWLLRNLQAHVARAVACDPRRNALVGGGGAGDKDDARDAEKLCDLYLGGYTQGVYHAASLERVLVKETVGLYHERVGQRVRSANKVMGLLKRWGIMARERDFAAADRREALAAQVGGAAAGLDVWSHVEILLSSYDEAIREERQLRRELVRRARQEEVVVRWQAVPGIGWIRGLTLLAYLDTPWRFRSKQALWKYLGIGLRRSGSGQGPVWVSVEQRANHVLKGVILGAAETVLLRKAGELYRRYERWRETGLSFRNARRNVARDLAQVLWAMWKNGGTYDERLLGGVRDPACAAEGGGAQSR
jgi:transposase